MENANITWVHHRTVPFVLITFLLWSFGSLPALSAEVQKDPESLATHGYALLFDLLGDEKDVSKLLLIKRERPDFGKLIKDISKLSATAHKHLEAFAKAEPKINLKDLGLPSAEVATRKSIGKTRGKELLAAKGKTLELQLLLTQNEAMTYGAHLAAVTARAERNAERAKYLDQLSINLREFQQKVVAMLAAHYTWSAPK